VKRVAVLIPLALLASACGGGATKSSNPPLQTVQVSEKEFSITPTTITLSRSGTYAFRVTNDGQITHAFQVGSARTSDIAPGQSATLTVDLPRKGRYKAFCPIDGHRSKGMEATIDVGVAPGVPASTTTTTPRTTTGSTTATTPTSSSPGY
jgi:uncharacterized cupredoxin-like copper-binding protein